MTLMEHTFANSYGQPFVGVYNPPTCSFNRIVLNLTVTTAGLQFDRLAAMYLNDTEIWRMSTAEPTRSGITWTYTKDASSYLPLFRLPQKIIFDLANAMDSTYTASFNTTLTAMFFTAPGGPDAADVIIPVSSMMSASNQSSAFIVPQSNGTSTFAIPRNVKKAIFTVLACGQNDEEFWWSNVLSSDTDTFEGHPLLGFSPFREVQVLIDGQLAGVSWPFPVIFTGGIVPGFWRPLVGIDVFDLQEDELDVSPWLPVLSDGRRHSFEIRVVGIADDGFGDGVLTTVGDHWVVSGKLFLWLDNGVGAKITSGTPMNRILPGLGLSITSSTIPGPDGPNSTLSYQVRATRKLSLSCNLTTSDGAVPVSWTQTLNYSNEGTVKAVGNDVSNTQLTSGVEISSFGYLRRFSYQLAVSGITDFDPDSGNLSISAQMDRRKDMQILGPSVFPSGLETLTFASDAQSNFKGSTVSTRQNGTASFQRRPATDVLFSYGSTEQYYQFAGVRLNSTVQAALPAAIKMEELSSRHVLAVNGTIVEDNDTDSIQ